MFIKCMGYLVTLLLFCIHSAVADEVTDGDKFHPQAVAYCADLTLNKQILIADYQNGGYSTSMSTDLSVYDQSACQQTIDRLITKESSLVLSASPLLFDLYPGVDGQPLPVTARTFDYSFICLATQTTNITLSSADHWDVLNCIKNKANIRVIHLKEFTYKTLDLRLLKQFKSLERLSLSSGELTHFSSLTDLTLLESLTLANVDITPEQFGYIAKLVNLIHLKIESSAKVKVRDFIALKKLESLELVAIAFHGPDLTGLNEFTSLTHLNLQDSQVTDADYRDILQLSQLQRLNLAYNIGITTLAPLKDMVRLEQLSINGTSVTDLAPLATHQGLFGQGYNIGANLHFNDSKLVDLTSYYGAGGTNDSSSELLGCSPTSRKEYLAGKSCNEQQRRECKMPGYGLIDYYISAPLCVWWYGD